jgi:hypothetical protein
MIITKEGLGEKEPFMGMRMFSKDLKYAQLNLKKVSGTD